MPDEGNLEVEILRQTYEDHRFYGDLRFKQLTVFALFTGVLLNAAVSDGGVPVLSGHHNRTLFSFIGMLFTAVFWVMEVRSTIWGLHHRPKKGAWAWESPASSGATPTPGVTFHWALLSATNAVLIIYIAPYGLWWWVWKAAGQMTCWGWVAWIGFAAVGFVLLVFTAREYLQIWNHARSKWQW